MLLDERHFPRLLNCDHRLSSEPSNVITQRSFALILHAIHSSDHRNASQQQVLLSVLLEEGDLTECFSYNLSKAESLHALDKAISFLMQLIVGPGGTYFVHNLVQTRLFTARKVAVGNDNAAEDIKQDVIQIACIGRSEIVPCAFSVEE